MRVLVAILTLTFSLTCLAASDATCLALALHKEASGESLKGKRATLDTILARMYDNGLTACQTLRVAHQYSWVGRNTVWKATPEMLSELYKVEDMDKVLDERFMWFYGSNLSPIWARKMKCVKIGKHKYCRK